MKRCIECGEELGACAHEGYCEDCAETFSRCDGCGRIRRTADVDGSHGVPRRLCRACYWSALSRGDIV